MANVCPLGLCRFEEVCPNAPCIDCMHALGAHMIEEARLMEKQIDVARRKGDQKSVGILTRLFASLGLDMTLKEAAFAGVPVQPT